VKQILQIVFCQLIEQFTALDSLKKEKPAVPYSGLCEAGTGYFAVSGSGAGAADRLPSSSLY